MANKKDNTKRYDVEHLRNLARYRAQVDAIYRALTKEAAAIASGIDTEIPEDMFSFADYPKTMKRVDALIAAYRADMQKVIVNGVKSEWTLANNKNNELARQVFGGKAGKLTAEQERRYYKNNDTARDAFLGRKERGLSLSDRVWDYSGKFKSEIEMGIDLCLRKGMPAAEMARELQKYLKHPDELFRRVRDEHGILKLSQAAKDYHPGRGVYRSSYKNALRLAITETNMAYRLADWERWQQMDFVVGIRIQLSNNHTCLGPDGLAHPFYDICDELAGDYPKTFKWTGWHPQCRCNAVPILKTVDEKIADNMARRNGQAPAKESVNSVKKMPKVFTDWLKGNKNRIATAKSQPYFIRDNEAAVSRIIPGVLPEDMIPATPLPIAERAKMRHDARTAEEIADIRRRWTLREAAIRHAARTQEQAEATRNAWNDRHAYRIDGVKQLPVLNGDNYGLTKQISDIEANIRGNKTFETAVAVDMNGSIVIDKRGGHTQVDFTSAEVAKMKDCIITHNHPRGWDYEEKDIGRIGNSFSISDIKLAISGNVVEIRAVTPNYTFSMKRPKKGWGISEKEIQLIYDRESNNLYNEFSVRIQKGTLTITHAQAMHFHLLWKKISEELGWEYRKMKTK